MLAVLDRGLGWLLKAGAALAALLMILCVSALGYGMAVRWVTGGSSTWPIDMSGHVLVYIVMLAAAEAFRRGEHINVDLLIVNLSPRGKAIADKWASLAVLVTAGILFWTGVDMVSFSRSINLHTADYVELPFYLVQIAMPVGALLLAAVALRRLIAPYDAHGETGP